MKKFAVFVASICLSCISKDNQQKEIQVFYKQNLYDLYYSYQFNNNNFKYVGLDSIGMLKGTEDFFAAIDRKDVFDSITINEIINNKSEFQDKVKLTDSIKEKIKFYNQNKSYQAQNFFSKPLKVSDNSYILFVQTSHLMGGSNSVVYYSKKLNNRWTLDSIQLLENFRGGGLTEK